MARQKAYKDVSELAKNGAAAPAAIDRHELDSPTAVIEAIPQAEIREEPVDEAPEWNPQAENLIRWQLSEWPQKWVAEREGHWNHEDWMELLGAIAESEFWPMSPEGVGRLIEEEARRLNLKSDNLKRWKTSGLPEQWVKDLNGEWDHEDWTDLLGELAESEFWPMTPESVGQVLEEIKGSIEFSPAPAFEEGAQTGTGVEDVAALQAENLRRWLDSGQARAWVDGHKRDWNHDDWTGLLGSLAESEFWPMEPEEIGRALEEMRRSCTADETPEVPDVTPDTIPDSSLGREAEPTGPPESDRNTAVGLLVAGGASVNARDRLEQTPLHRAAFSGDEETVLLLLSNGADVHARTQDGRTALHMAAAGHHSGVIAILLQWGAEIDAADQTGVTPLHLAVMDQVPTATETRYAVPIAAPDIPLAESCQQEPPESQPSNGSAVDEHG
jgi:hypothetical protein